MPVLGDFNTEATPIPKQYSLNIVNDHVVYASTQNDRGYSVNTIMFDFLNRLVTVAPNSGDNRTFTFAEFDEGSIEWHYNKMLEAGKKPRAPASLDGKPAAPRPRSGLNA